MGDYMRVLGDDGRWRLAEVRDDRELAGSSSEILPRSAEMSRGECELAGPSLGQVVSRREVLAREVPTGSRDASHPRHGMVWESWVPCAEAHRFRCTCGEGHLMMREESGAPFDCPGNFGNRQCDGCPGRLSESDARVRCAICDAGSPGVCFVCANAHGHSYSKVVGAVAAAAVEKTRRRETIEHSRHLPVASFAQVPIAHVPPRSGTLLDSTWLGLIWLGLA